MSVYFFLMVFVMVKFIVMILVWVMVIMKINILTCCCGGFSGIPIEGIPVGGMPMEGIACCGCEGFGLSSALTRVTS